MIRQLAFSVSSEWLKQKRSLTFRLVLGSACFIPTIILLSRFRRSVDLPALYRTPGFWDTLWVQTWESMALMILPLAIMLLVTLITQIEDRGNAWKQVLASPQTLATVFVAKLIVILVLVIELVLLCTVAIYVCGVVPPVLVAGVNAPARFPLAHFLARDLAFLLDVLPIVALQYLLALRFRTFLTPLGVGLALWIVSIGTMSWSYRYLVPYSYAGIDYLAVEYRRQMAMPARPSAIASGCFVVFTVISYALYVSRRDKG